MAAATGGAVTKEFGNEVWTPYSGNALNRLSFLREDQAFLHQAFHSPDARFLPFKEFNPLLSTRSRLEWLSADQLGPALLGDPYKKSLKEVAADWDPERDASGCSHAQIVFLGVDESARGRYSGHKDYPGSPRFAVDVTTYEQALPPLRTALESFYGTISQQSSLGFESTYLGLTFADPLEFSIVAEGRILLDWINRVRFCAGCGKRNLSVWGGFKLLCSASLQGAQTCPSEGKITYLSFPRTDCCVIVAIVSHDGNDVLIARGKRFRGNMYSCLAGFLEGGESIEDCVRREAFEEAGVKVGNVKMLASQPWPFPSNLMIGCLAEVADADPASHRLVLEHDKELADAKWVSREDLKKLCRGEGDFGFSLPPEFSIAWTLLDAASKLGDPHM